MRQADRIILENVSKTQGLTSGLQFLCSGVSSLSAMLSGLKYALKQVKLCLCESLAIECYRYSKLCVLECFPYYLETKGHINYSPFI